MNDVQDKKSKYAAIDFYDTNGEAYVLLYTFF